MIPGPLLTSIIAESTRRGWTAGPLVTLGHGMLELALIMAVMAGLAVFLTNQAVVSVIAVLGGSFLLYLGYATCREALAVKIELRMDSAEIPSSLHPVLAGILISLSNPTWILWWATIGLTYLTLAMNYGWSGVLIFFCGHIMADLSWHTLVSSMVAGGRNFLNPRIFNGILAFCGLFLLAMGGFFLYTGITLLIG